MISKKIIAIVSKQWKYVYNMIFTCLIPLIVLRLLWRSRLKPGFLLRLLQSFGITKLNLDHAIWIHAVSLGEAVIAEKLLLGLIKTHPNIPIVITTVTLTGANYIQKICHNNIYHCYFPYDLNSNWSRFLKKIHPKILIIIETEIWPNLINACHKKNIPVVIANACISPRSLRGYQLVQPVMQEILSLLTLVIVQSKYNASRFLSLGINKHKLAISGNIKFDIQLPENIDSPISTERPIWIAASTHAGEEAIILASHKQILEKIPQALLIVVPRHPERFNTVAKLINQAGFSMARRSKQQNFNTETQVYLADTMGELFSLYSLANLAFVGGSLVDIGGHNLLEPASLAKAIISGPHLDKCQAIAELFVKNNCLTIVHDERSLTDAVLKLFNDKPYCNQQGSEAQKIINTNRGALAKHLQLINEILSR